MKVTVCAQARNEKDPGHNWVDEMTLWSVTSVEGGERIPIVVAVCECGHEQVVG